MRKHSGNLRLFSVQVPCLIVNINLCKESGLPEVGSDSFLSRIVDMDMKVSRWTEDGKVAVQAISTSRPEPDRILIDYWADRCCLRRRGVEHGWASAESASIF